MCVLTWTQARQHSQVSMNVSGFIKLAQNEFEKEGLFWE